MDYTLNNKNGFESEFTTVWTDAIEFAKTTEVAIKTVVKDTDEELILKGELSDTTTRTGKAMKVLISGEWIVRMIENGENSKRLFIQKLSNQQGKMMERPSF